MAAMAKDVQKIKEKSWQYQVLARVWYNQNSPMLLLKVSIDTTILEIRLAVSPKSEHIYT